MAYSDVRDIRVPKSPTESGWGFSHSRGPQLATFTAPTPLTRQICHALAVLRQARHDGNADRITLAAARLDRLLDRYPQPPAHKGITT